MLRAFVFRHRYTTYKIWCTPGLLRRIKLIQICQPFTSLRTFQDCLKTSVVFDLISERHAVAVLVVEASSGCLLWRRGEYSVFHKVSRALSLRQWLSNSVAQKAQVEVATLIFKAAALLKFTSQVLIRSKLKC